MSKAVTYRIIHPDGLYAGLVERLIKFAGDFNSDISISYGGRTVNLKSFMGVVSLGVPNKADITITADGYDENKAIREFEKQLRALKVIQ